jgi:sugar lactone lactonase YvrE
VTVAGEVDVVVPAGDRCGEGVAVIDGVVWWTDVCRFLLHRLDPATGAYRSWDLGEPVVGVVGIDRSSVTADHVGALTEVLVACGSRILRWDAESGRSGVVEHREPEWPRVRLNEVRADPTGALWVGSMGNNVGPAGESTDFPPSAGRLVRLGGSTPQVVRSGVGISNTLAWDVQRRRAYTADTVRDEIYAYELDDDGRPGAVRTFSSAPVPGRPDGSAIDAEGHLWNCRFGGGAVVRLDPGGGVDRVVELPTANPTTCAFAGDGSPVLYVSSASISTDPSDRLAGSLWAVDTGVSGTASHRWRPVTA